MKKEEVSIIMNTNWCVRPIFQSMQIGKDRPNFKLAGTEV